MQKPYNAERERHLMVFPHYLKIFLLYNIATIVANKYQDLASQDHPQVYSRVQVLIEASHNRQCYEQKKAAHILSHIFYLLACALPSIIETSLYVFC